MSVVNSHPTRALWEAEHNLSLEIYFTFPLETWTMKYLIPSELNDDSGFVKAILLWH